MTRGLVLSLFPGIDLLGRAFEAAGWCVVRGPDVILGGDIRGWSVPAGRFDGVIGGPPCQMFSRLVNIVRANGYEPKFGNLIPEFERVVSEAQPRWWLMEEVPEAPIPDLFPYYLSDDFMLSPRDLGDVQSRRRRFTFGVCASLRIVPCLLKYMPLVEVPPIEFRHSAVGGTSTPANRGRDGKVPLPENLKTLAALQELLSLQGWPELADILPGPWTIRGACKAIGNGVPRIVGEALARAIGEWMDEESCMSLPKVLPP